MVRADYHTHTRNSDSPSSAESVCQFAKKHGLSQIALTDHSFFSFPACTTNKNFFALLEKKDKLQEKFGIEVLIGVEANILSDGSIDVPDEIIKHLDILNLGFHRFLRPSVIVQSPDFMLKNGYGNKAQQEEMIEVNTKAYLKALRTYPIDTLTHLGHRCLVDFGQVVTSANDTNTHIELNEKHAKTLEENIDSIMCYNPKFILGSDAHLASRVGKFDKVFEVIEKHNIDKSKIVGIESFAVLKQK